MTFFPFSFSARGGRMLSILLGLTVCGCSRLTDVSAPDVVQLGSLGNAAGAEALRVGSISGFALVFAGARQGQITTSGTMADEFFNASTGVIALAGADIRVSPDPGLSYPYAAVQRSRLDAERAIDALRQFAPASRAKIGEQFALAAYTELFLGENMCSGIPLGHVVNGNLEYGQPLATSVLFATSVVHFDTALTTTPDTSGILNLARVGRGRALLDLGRYADAAASVASVPTSYAYTLQYSTAQPNGVFNIINIDKWITVADREGGNGLDFRNGNDPRVPTAFVGKGVDAFTDVYNFTRYANVSSPIVLASGVEARLIAAETALHAGDASGALQILNTLRAMVPGLVPLPFQTTEDARVDQLFRERAFWLFATGHRHGDLRRLVRQYARPQVTVFPSGPYKNGQTYGSDVDFAPDASQLGNPDYAGCASRGA